MFSSESTATTLSVLCLASLVFANLVFFAEASDDNETFNSADYVGGITTALWFVVVTVTTTGYGDIVPQTRRGRFVASVWMGVGLIIMASFSADVLSRMTASRSAEVTGGIVGPGSMTGKVCGTTEGTPWIELCASWGATVKAAKSKDELYKAFLDGETDAVVYDWPVLELWMQADEERMRTVHMPWRSTTDGPFGPGYPHLAKPAKDDEGGGVNPDDLAAFERHYRMREKLNLAFLSLRGGDFEANLVKKYFGGLSIAGLDSSSTTEELYTRAKVSDPTIALCISAIVIYLALLASHALGHRISMEHIMPKMLFPMARQEPSSEKMARQEPSLGESPSKKAAGSDPDRLARLERSVDRLGYLLEVVDDKMNKLVRRYEVDVREREAVAHHSSVELSVMDNQGAPGAREGQP